MFKTKFDIPIFHEAYELIKKMDHYHDSIPKKKRYALWQTCDTLAIEVLTNIMKASNERVPQKRKIVLEELLLIIDQLQVFLRLCHETQCLSEKQYLTLVTHLDNIGKMVGGWMKSMDR